MAMSPQSGAPSLIATICAAGTIYGAWESVKVKREIGNAVSSFTFVAAEGGYGPNYAGLKLGPTDPVEIWLGNEKVIQGAVTNRAVAYDKSSHQVVISGRSITSKIVKTSVPIMPGGYSGSTMEQITRSMLQPHGIGLSLVNPPAIASMPFQSLYPEPSESKADLIERLRVHRGLFVWDDANGNLVLGQGNPSEAPIADLVEGRNILGFSGSLNNDTAFGQWAAVSQTVGSDSNWPSRDQGATATNPGAVADEKKTVIAPHPSNSQELTALVNHYQSQSLWSQVNVTVTVFGWTQPNGALWVPVRNATLFSPMLFPNQSGKLLLGIQAVEWSQDQNGSTTALTLVLTGALNGSQVGSLPDVSGDKFVGTAQKTNVTGATPDAPDTVTST